MAQKKAGIIVILSSPSGAGKTTLVKKISKRKNYKISIFMQILIYGDKRIRTADICRAKAALYQLSYTPIQTLNGQNLIKSTV